MNSGPLVALQNEIAATGLQSRSTQMEPLEVMAEDWPHLRKSLLGHRLTGLALAACQRGEILLSEADLNELSALQRDAMVLALLLERRLVEISVAFETSGIEFVVLKGPAVAHSSYPDPAWRPFSDLDLLVPRPQWEDACALLTQLGYRRDLPEPRPNFDVRFGKAVLFSSQEGSVDLHSTLASGPFGLWIDPNALFEDTETLELGRTKIKRLGDTSMLLHACVHASLGWRPPLLLPLRDVLQTASVLRIDWKRLRALSHSWRLDGVLQHAFITAAQRLGVALPTEVDNWLHVEIGRRERRALEAYTTERRSFGGTSLATLGALPGVRHKTAYVRSLLLPTRDFLAARTDKQQRPSYWRRLTTPLGWLAAGRRHR